MKCRFGLIGKKLGHSYSPFIHNELFKIRKKDASYELIECQKEQLHDQIMLLRNGIYQGFNVTIPYKEAIIPYLDLIDDKAKRINAVNTISYENGKVIGYNTDYDGFIKQLKRQQIDVYKRKCFILGTGGASKSCYWALVDLGADVVFVSRTKKDDKTVSYDDLVNLEIDIIVNTTPVGMYPQINNCPLPDDIIAKADVIIDIIFNPTYTVLLQKKKSPNNGLPMLVYQADAAEKIWFKDNESHNLELVFHALEEMLKDE